MNLLVIFVTLATSTFASAQLVPEGACSCRTAECENNNVNACDSFGDYADTYCDAGMGAIYGSYLSYITNGEPSYGCGEPSDAPSYTSCECNARAFSTSEAVSVSQLTNNADGFFEQRSAYNDFMPNGAPCKCDVRVNYASTEEPLYFSYGNESNPVFCNQDDLAPADGWIGDGCTTPDCFVFYCGGGANITQPADSTFQGTFSNNVLDCRCVNVPGNRVEMATAMTEAVDCSYNETRVQILESQADSTTDGGGSTTSTDNVSSSTTSSSLSTGTQTGRAKRNAVSAKSLSFLAALAFGLGIGG